ncbi:HNH endonuclease signature motif containing protein [Chryseobacterium sp.]|uniref:HNH endonuclease n=1 Tax=Chryseobacterium sp. TaxID=1871047 RepID=UPI0024E21E09|nr:HNH endonuclease signature motif containing protein [Chryseobacterium sp.]
MRAINKGVSTTEYSVYGDARHDLGKRLGYYCSYCEMATNNMIEVEHVHPINNGGDELSWDNFLLSCKYCNTIKSDRNKNRDEYCWPDIDNTDLLFNYTLDNRILEIKTTLSPTLKIFAGNLIDLVGLNRYPGNHNEPTEADTRWRLRDEARTTAMSSYNRWFKVKSDPGSTAWQLLLEQIAETSLIGFYSVWCKVFEGEEPVLNEIDRVWKLRYNNYKEFDHNYLRVIREGANI